VDKVRWGREEESAGKGLFATEDRLRLNEVPGSPGGIYSRECRGVSKLSSSGRPSIEVVGLGAPIESAGSTAYSSLKTLGLTLCTEVRLDVLSFPIENDRCEEGRRAMGAAPPCREAGSKCRTEEVENGRSCVR
jgi:hypothetical protein